MTAPDPSLMEQATIDRLGIFDEEKFAEIVEHSDDVPVCASGRNGVRCGLPATHIATCVVCGLNPQLICTGHADEFTASTKIRTHTPCGSRDELRNLLRVVEL